MNISSRFNYDRIYFIIFSLIVIVGSLIALEQKSTKFFNLIFKENQLLIDGKENKIFLYSDILNFNLFPLFPKKKLGYVLRINHKKDNFYFWITTNNKNMKWSGDDYSNIALLKNSFIQKVTKKQIFLDYIIYSIALIPFLLILSAFLFVLIILFSLLTGNTGWFQHLEFISNYLNY
ncbi:hypothetical protein ETU08_02480 [Apibacter muscae]|nr:hypothetical protein ETU08_02480 [Apibacter muscae]